jgi:hypothetical protein
VAARRRESGGRDVDLHKKVPAYLSIKLYVTWLVTRCSVENAMKMRLEAAVCGYSILTDGGREKIWKQGPSRRLTNQHHDTRPALRLLPIDRPFQRTLSLIVVQGNGPERMHAMVYSGMYTVEDGT